MASHISVMAEPRMLLSNAPRIKPAVKQTLFLSSAVVLGGMPRLQISRALAMSSPLMHPSETRISCSFEDTAPTNPPNKWKAEPSTVDIIQSIVAKQFGLHPSLVTPETKFLYAGGDSMDVAEIVAVEKRFGVKIGPKAYYLDTIQDAFDFVNKQKAKPGTVDITRSIVARQLRVNPRLVTSETEFLYAGGDSMDMAEIVLAVEKRFGVKIGSEAYYLDTIQDAADFVDKQKFQDNKSTKPEVNKWEDKPRTVDIIRGLVARQLGVNPRLVTPETKFLYADKIVLAVEKRFGVQIGSEAHYLDTIQDAADFVDKLRAPASL